jgi:uncharacterized protein with PQ loop repeat
MEENKTSKKLPLLSRILIEVGFIVFLFYSNLLMGEYSHSGLGQTKGLLWAMEDMFTLTNFAIAIVLALIGYLIFDYLLKRRV